jgi:hypothetical protein
MRIAAQKLQENIAEYILYMYQVEDVIRAYKFDVDLIMEHYVQPQLPDSSFSGQYKTWYEGLIRSMKAQKIEKSGHLDELKEIMIELSYLHTTMLNMPDDTKYKEVYDAANKYLEEFKLKSDLKDKNHIEIAFHAMYMKLLLKLQKKEISPETEEAFDGMRMMLAYLSRSYRRMKAGDLDFLKN